MSDGPHRPQSEDRRAPAAPRPDIRASDAERDRAMDVLRDGAAEGRLTFEELADRLEATGAAVTRSDLARLTVDLPPADPPLVGRGTGTALGPVLRQSTVFGDLTRSGSWRLSASSRWSTVFGDVVLDLREAVVAHGHIEIEARTVFGDITLFVPEGVVVDVRSRTGFGSVKQQAGLSASSDGPVVVLTGGTWFGDVRVQRRRLRERLADLLRGRAGA